MHIQAYWTLLGIYWDILNVTFCYEVLIYVQTMEHANNIVFYFLERGIEVKLYFELGTKTCWENVFIFKLKHYLLSSCHLQCDYCYLGHPDKVY